MAEEIRATMRVVCPSCTAAYDVPDAALGTGLKRLRCARCQQEWTVEAAAPQADTSRGATSAPDFLGSTDQMADADLPGKATASAMSLPGAEAGSASAPASLGLFAESPIGSDVGTRPGSRDARTPKLPSFEGHVATQSHSRVAAGSVVLAWVLSLTVLGFCAAAAVIWRTDVMRAWPPSERAYVVFGLR